MTYGFLNMLIRAFSNIITYGIWKKLFYCFLTKMTYGFLGKKTYGFVNKMTYGFLDWKRTKLVITQASEVLLTRWRMRWTAFFKTSLSNTLPMLNDFQN